MAASYGMAFQVMEWCEITGMVISILGWWDMFDTVYHVMACFYMSARCIKLWHVVTCMLGVLIYGMVLHVWHAIHVMVYTVILWCDMLLRPIVVCHSQIMWIVLRQE